MTKFLRITKEDEDRLIAGARDIEPVRGLTHNFYRYPARFSQAFARAAIETFSEPGDLIMDPHVGGGTSLVEALALGRNAVGVDISSLAEFVATVKTTVFSDHDLELLDGWAKALPDAIDIRRPSIHFADYYERGYYKHLDHPQRWRARKAVEQALASAMRLPQQLESFGRCVVLRTAQMALDGRKTVISVPAMRELFGKNAREMVIGSRRFREAVANHAQQPSAQILFRSAAGIEDDARLASVPAPRVVVTSPPYPGVHVLYHRWQVGGGRETAAPFWIAKKLDGAGASYYTMGDRKEPEKSGYFAKVQATLSSVAALCDEATVFVQMLAFHEPQWQLQRYLQAMEAAGLTEVFLPSLATELDGRLWRNVPNRKWYSDQQGDTPASKEVVLLHQLSKAGIAASRHRRALMQPSAASLAKLGTAAL
ncbi:hypothetical protein EN780_05740 [Mesorhizobium sp. M4B.F.Ca.ET.089.01.1.1]|uniref:DNA methyltransferase n=1 Tax=Mesorhizobium sp. M4B.F.Ca.ET.089.01.1.1 TaxID=2496662 RepID=UPI000FE3BE95|nr:DNA methyltransferase [Mesorhizobium sp. M4B.F.Ca.ET.089.01.1.1]RWX69624.1 hypothetical protein EN780_05740 [Mesorhizobium sp. M4B.F.Ca.ET.089.01.1.1]